MATQRTADLGSFAPGLNNRLEPTKLATRLADRSQATYLYGAENVDLNGEGYIKRRRGQTLRDATASHSLWSDLKGGYIVQGTDLRRFDNGTLGTVIRANMPPRAVSYSRGADGVVYWTNGSDIRRIDGTDKGIAPMPPSPAPAVAVTSGALSAGKYLIAFTVSNDDGESPATVAIQLDVPENGGIMFLADEVVNAFMSGPNGDILTFQTRASGDAIVVHNETGRRCETLNTALMPAGDIVRHYNGRMLVAAGPSLYASNPYNYGVYDPSVAYFPFPEDITIVEPMENGIYIVADKTYWINDLFTDTLQAMLPYGGVLGSSIRSPDEQTAYWSSVRGLIQADKNAAVKNLQEAALDVAPARTGATLYRERDGTRHVVSTRFGVEPSVAVATSYMEAEVIRKGTVL